MSCIPRWCFSLEKTGRSIRQAILIVLAVGGAVTGWGAVPAITGPASSIVSPIFGTVDVAFSQQIVATNSTTRYTASGLPPGLVLNSATGVISGTPKLPGTYRVDIAAANADGVSYVQPTMSNRTALYIKIWPGSGAAVAPVADTTGWLPVRRWELGQAESHTITATQLDNVSRFVALDPLPPGLVLNGAVLSGAPIRAGLFGMRVAVTNRNGYDVLPVTIYVPSPGTDPARPVIAALADVACKAEDPIEVMPAATGDVERYAAGYLPAGLVLDPKTGRISGSTDLPGTHLLTLAARGATGWSEPVSFALSVEDAPTFYSGSALGTLLMEENLAVSTSVTFNSTQPATLAVAGLPPGLTFTPPAAITGTPTQKGVYDVALTLSNANGSRTRHETIVVVRTAWQVLTDANTASRNAIAFGAGRFVRVGTAGVIEYSSDGATWTAAISGTSTTLNVVAYGGGRFVAAGNGVAVESADGITWTAMAVPPVTGTPTAVACDNSGVIVLIGSRTASAPAGGSWTATTSFPGVLSPVGVGFHNGKFIVYGSSATAVAGSEDGVTWAVDTLPNNIYVDLGLGYCGDRYVRSSAVTSKVETSFDGVSWTSRPPYKFSYLKSFAYGNGVIVGLGRYSSQHLLVRNGGTWEPELTVPPTVYATRGQALDLQVTCTEGPLAFYAWGLPEGLTINASTGRIQGTVTQGGTISAGVTAENALGPAKTASILFRISDSTANPPAMAGLPAVGALEGEAFAYDPLIGGAAVAPTGLPVQVNYAATGLPPGVVMDGATGRLSGTPTTAGRYQTDYTVSGVFGTERQRVTTVVASAHRVARQIAAVTANVRPLWFSGGLFAAELGAGTAAFSTDGETWSGAVTIASGESLTGFAQGAGVAVFSTSGAVYVSADRVNWTRYALSGTANADVCYLGGRFLLFNRSASAPKVVTSVDGAVWNETALTGSYPGLPVSIAYGAGTYVCKMDNETAVQVSSDGVTWERVETPANVTGGVYYQAGRFVIPAYTAMSSPDGRTWTLEAVGGGTGLPESRIVPFGGWLAGYVSGAMCLSTDGLAWQRFSMPTSPGVTDIAAGNGRLLLRTSQAGPAAVLVSGNQWVLPQAGSAVKTAYAGQVFNWQFTLVDEAASLSWHAENLPAGLSIDNTGLVSGVPQETGSYRSLIWAKTADETILAPVAVQFNFKPGSGAAPTLPGLFSLTDAVFGANYTMSLPVVGEGLGLSVAVTGLPAGLAYNPQTKTIEGLPTQPGTSDVAVTAADSYGSRSWTLPLRVLNGDFTSLSAKPSYSMALAWNGTNAFVALGGGQTLTSGVLSFSANGFVWENVVTTGLPSLCAVAWGGGQFVAVGREGAILTSPDGRSWTRRTAVSSADLLGVAYGGGQWIAVGVGGAAARSGDGATWTAVSTGVAVDLYAAAHDGTAFFAVGKTGTIRRSADAQTWTTVASSVTRDLRTIAIGGSTYVIGMTGGRILTSSNGTTWTDRFIGSSTNVNSTVYGLVYRTDQGFALTLYNYVDNSNYDTRFMRSNDGVTWRQVSGYGEVSRSLLLTDKVALSGNSSHTLRILPLDPAPEIKTATTVSAYPHVPFHFDLAPWGMTGAVSATGLPAGLSVNATTGLISGTPTESGSFLVQAAVAGAPGAKINLKIQIMAGLPSLLSDKEWVYIVDLFRGDAVDVKLHTLHPASSWRSASGTAALPAGISLDTTTGRLVGRALASGTFGHQIYTSNPWGEVLGTLFLRIQDPEAAFTRQPVAQSAVPGGTATFSADASLPGGTRFQWFRNGERLVNGGRISGATGATLSIYNITADDAGVYELRVENDGISVLSEGVALTVNPTLTGYAAWASEHAAELSDASATAAPFGDGVSNLLRYALGLPLHAVVQPDYLVYEMRDGRLVLRYVRPKDRSDLAYMVESSGQLTSWSQEGVTQAKTADDGELETWEGSAPVEGARRFLRLRITLTGE